MTHQVENFMTTKRMVLAHKLSITKSEPSSVQIQFQQDKCNVFWHSSSAVSKVYWDVNELSSCITWPHLIGWEE